MQTSDPPLSDVLIDDRPISEENSDPATGISLEYTTNRRVFEREEVHDPVLVGERGSDESDGNVSNPPPARGGGRKNAGMLQVVRIRACGARGASLHQDRPHGAVRI